MRVANLLKRLFGKYQGPAIAPHMEAIEDHVGRYVGPTETVLHEIVSDVVHIDVHWVKPGYERPFHFLYTTGMSALPMPGNLPNYRFAEVGTLLPADWPLDELEKQGNEEYYWPIRVLKTFARLPVTNKVCVPRFISIPSSHPEQIPYAGTSFYGAMLAPPVVFDEGFEALVVGEDVIHFHLMMPMTLPEMEYKVAQRDSDALWQRVVESGRDPREFLVIDRERASLVLPG